VIRELTTTRANHLVDPSVHVWAWQIPVYLFLGGLVAGLMILSGVMLLRGRLRGPGAPGAPGGSAGSLAAMPLLPVLELALLSVGMLALFLDLEHKPYVWRLYTTFMPQSPMSWGAWILVLVYPALLAHLVLVLPPEWAERLPGARGWAERLRAAPSAAGAVGWMLVGLGIALGIYTGVLLSALGARPLWNSAILGPLFLLSGLSGAAALGHVLAREDDERAALVRADNRLLAGEMLAIALLLIGLVSSTQVHQAAAGLFLGGPFTAVFWVGVVAAGIVLPLFLQLLAARHRVPHLPVAPLLVLAGGLLLRFVIVYAGQFSHWTPV
jgi:formate-dependent nitrite reductase membrane component NrfD